MKIVNQVVQLSKVEENKASFNKESPRLAAIEKARIEAQKMEDDGIHVFSISSHAINGDIICVWGKK